MFVRTNKGVDMAGLAESAQLLSDGLTTSSDLVGKALKAATDSDLNAFRLLRASEALVEAKAADERLAAGERLPLLGVPIAIKDDVDLAGAPTAFGCAGDFPVAEADCELVRRVKAAGAVIIGKTNTPEFGQWPVTEGSFGATRNPWNPDYSPGGSSGGSAAAVAAGIVPAAVGSDGAGSIRIPAAWTNLVGIKPTRGLVPTAPEPELFHGLTTSGPLARTVADAALLLDVLTGGDYSAAVTAPVRPLRIALSMRPAFTAFRVRVDPDVRAAVYAVARTLMSLGHSVSVADPAYGLIGLSFLPRSFGGIHDWTRRVPDAALLDARTRHNGRVGRLLGHGLGASRATLGFFARRIGAVFTEFDVVLTPTTATPPLPVGSIDGLPGWRTDRRVVTACPFAWPWNVLGWPGVNVPAGFTPSGLPVGAQLLGPADSEPLLISLAAQLEAASDWAATRPPIR
nr:amidase [Actinokineospora fastidiosa]